ncbi:hypothetical protein AB0B67_46905, partial [Streptomyces spectabilis]
MLNTEPDQIRYWSGRGTWRVVGIVAPADRTPGRTEPVGALAVGQVRTWRRQWTEDGQGWQEYPPGGRFLYLGPDKAPGIVIRLDAHPSAAGTQQGLPGQLPHEERPQTLPPEAATPAGGITGQDVHRPSPSAPATGSEQRREVSAGAAPTGEPEVSPASADEAANGSAAPAPGADDSGRDQPAPDDEPDSPVARKRKRREQNQEFGEVLGVDPAAGETFEGYAGRWGQDYDITTRGGRYLFRYPKEGRKHFTVHHMPDPTRSTETQQVGRASKHAEIMPLIRKHAARVADPSDPSTVELSDTERAALDLVGGGADAEERQQQRHTGLGEPRGVGEHRRD